jgi:hypothetical protein
MPNPTTIEELLKMRTCRYYDGQEITNDIYEDAQKNHCLYVEIWTEIYECWVSNKPFKMPDGYFYLPIGMELGLPLGEWTFVELKPLIDILPFGVLKKYVHNNDIAVYIYDETIVPDRKNDAVLLFDFNESSSKKLNILKQPPNLYNPLDHKEEVLMEDNSVNEEQLAKETAPMELPWRQDISTLPDDYEGDVWVYNETIKASFHYMKAKHTSWQELAHDCLTHKLYWLPLIPPKAPTVEVPVEPERISLQHKKVRTVPMETNKQNILPEPPPLPTPLHPYVPSPPSAGDLLTTSKNLVQGDRAEQYGDATDMFTTIAEFWSAYLETPIRPDQVGTMMMLMKVARIKQNPTHKDSYVDCAGYAGLAGEVAFRTVEEGKSK